MDQYIKQLLLLYSKVILPNLGAIVIANEETGELMFNEYLTYDDGKLSALLEKESTMDLQTAKNSVAKYVRELELLLNKGETYSIFKLGQFSKDKDGSIIFEGNIKTGGPSASDLTIGPSPTPPVVPIPKTSSKEDKVDPKKEEKKERQTEDKGEDKAELKPKEEKVLPREKVKEEPKLEDKKVPLKEEIKNEPSAKTDQEEQPKKEVVPPVKKVVITPIPKPVEKTEEPPKAKKNTYVEKPKVVDGSPIVEPIKKDEEVPPVIIVEEKKRRRGFLFWFLLLLFLLIIVGSVCVATNYEKVQQYLGWNSTEQTDEEAAKKAQLEKEKEQAEAERKRNDELNKELIVSNKDSLNNETFEEGISEGEIQEEPTEKPAEEVIPEETIPIASSTGNHYIVIGCFSEKSNADGLVNKYKQKGYDSKIISQLGGLYFVAAQSYPTFSEAKSELSRIRQDIDGAWLFKQ